MFGEGLFYLGSRALSLNSFAMPSKASAVVKGHRGLTKAGEQLALNVLDSGMGVWGDIQQLIAENPHLEEVGQQMAESLVMAKSNNTLAAYKSPVAEWQEFSSSLGCRAFPVDLAPFLLFLQSRLSYDVESVNKAGGLLNRVYGVDLMCSMLGFDRPGKASQVKLMMESARKQLGRPTIKKLACDKALLTRLVLGLVPDPSLEGLNLINLRTAVYCLLGFVLEGRWDEVSKLTLTDLTDYGSHFMAFIEVRKCDQHREGTFVPFVDSGEPRGACALLRMLLSVIPDDHPKDIPIFRHIDWGKVKGYIFRPRAIGYSRMRELVKEAFTKLGINGSLYALHSFRSGAATEIGRDTSIDSRLHDRHGGWAANSASKDGYIEESLENMLRIPLHLSI